MYYCDTVINENYTDKNTAASYFWKVVWWNESKAIDAHLMYAVNRLKHSAHPLVTLSKHTSSYLQRH